MTDRTQIVPIRRSSPLPPSEKQALAAELAKCLKLVASASMGAEQQTVWLHAAVDALEDIRAAEVAAISAELRRTVTRPAQIVPEIARLISERRKAPPREGGPMTAQEWADLAREKGLMAHAEAWERAKAPGQ